MKIFFSHKNKIIVIVGANTHDVGDDFNHPITLVLCYTSESEDVNDMDMVS